MTDQHTPGPWYFDRSGNITTIDEHAARQLFEPRTFGKLIASVHMDGGHLPVEANARLIASAPDLLAALEALLPMTNQIEVLGEWSALEINRRSEVKVRAEVDAVIALSRAAIRKARGEDAYKGAQIIYGNGKVGTALGSASLSIDDPHM